MRLELPSKSAGKAAGNAPGAPIEAAPGSLEHLASDYLVARLHQFLVSYGEPARLSDIAQGLVNDGASVNLVRQVLLFRRKTTCVSTRGRAYSIVVR